VAVKNKKNYILIFSLIIILTFSLIFYIFYYKKQNIGNTINIKNKEEFIAYVENIISYKANILVTVYSNKNQNEYNIFQEVTENKDVQIMQEPEELKGIVIEKENNIIRIKNTNLNLEKMYNEYSEYFNNLLDLKNFSESLKIQEAKYLEDEEEISIEIENIENPTNTYYKYSKLTFDKINKEISKLEIKDKKQKTIICILYNYIEINK
jgi:hypothetical protein